MRFSEPHSIIFSERQIVADSLKSKTLHALAWSFLEAAGQQGVRFVIGIVLARLLFPEQFGLIGMLTIFMAVAQAFLSSGFGAALIQKRGATPSDTCSIFYFNIVVGFAGGGPVVHGCPLDCLLLQPADPYPSYTGAVSNHRDQFLWLSPDRHPQQSRSISKP